VTPEQRKRLWVNGAWIAGILLLSGGLVAGAMAQLGEREAHVLEMQRSIEAKERALALHADADEGDRRRRDGESILDASRTMVDSEARRIVALSRAAEATGVKLSRLESLAPGGEERAGLLRRAHAVEVRGDYRRIAEFLAALNDAEGTVGIDDLVIEPDEDAPDATLSDRLHASLRATWYATAVREPSALAEGEAP
jgi:Tfp pilus assembly protein PilO